MFAAFRHELLVAALASLVPGLVLLTLRPANRAAARNALLLMLCCVVAELLRILVVPFGGARLGAVLGHFAAFGAGIAVIRLVLLFLFRVVLDTLRFRVVHLAEDLLAAAAFLVWTFIWLRFTGVDLASLVTTSAVITAVLAFAMQDTLGNILGGIVLQLDESMRVGDWVQIDDVRGRVTDVRWRYTAIETRNRETVYVPNSALMKNRFMVVGSRNDPAPRWRRWVWFNVDLDMAPARVCAALEKAVNFADIDNVSRDIPPSAVLMDVTEGCARYALRYWLVDPRDDDGTDSRVRAHALAALVRAGARLAVRREERLILAEDQARREALDAAEFARKIAALAGVPLFSHLSEEERSKVARHLVHAPFLKGDVVTRQGAVAHWLYLLISGQAEICDEQDGRRIRVADIGPGDICGERGMLTGEPRSATIVALSDLECYRLDKAGFEDVIRARPDIAEQMSRILEQRAAELSAKRAVVSGSAATTASRHDLLARMRTFFGLS